MAMGKFLPVDDRQAALCREVGIEHPEAFAVITETEDYLWLRHHKRWHEVTIRKSETKKRKEKELKLW